MIDWFPIMKTILNIFVENICKEGNPWTHWHRTHNIINKRLQLIPHNSNCQLKSLWKSYQKKQWLFLQSQKAHNLQTTLTYLPQRGLVRIRFVHCTVLNSNASHEINVNVRFVLFLWQTSIKKVKTISKGWN